jgi:uncharacterized membrane protein
MLQKETNLPEIDIIRGIAVIMMLTAHATVKWMNPYDFSEISYGINGLIFFIETFGATLFFFVTGLGNGISHRIGYHGDYRNVFYKAIILIVMDGFMCHQIPIIAGWDFLAFIAFSMLALQLVRGRQHAVLKAILAIAFFSLFRFIGAPIYKFLRPGADEINWITVAIGLHEGPGISYWFAPWFAFPFTGFVLGIMIRKSSSIIQQKKILLIFYTIISGILIGLASFYLYKNGAIYFRWATMSINYFIASFSVIAFSVAIAFLFTTPSWLDKFRQTISMRGISSLAVVPVHYFFLGIIAGFTSSTISPLIFYFILPFWLFICMFLAKLINRYSTVLSARLDSGWYLLPIVIICAVVLLFNHNSLATEIITLVAQLTLCILLSSSVKVFIPDKKFKLH